MNPMLQQWIENFSQSPLGIYVMTQNLAYLAPELILLVSLMFCIFQVFAKSYADRLQTWILALCGCLFSLACLVMHFAMIHLPTIFSSSDTSIMPVSYSVMGGMFQADAFSVLVRMALVTGTIVVLLMTKDYAEKNTRVPGELYLLLLGATLGGMLLAGASDLIMIFVALETMGITSYVMAGYLRDDVRSSEAALKYLLYGGAATAIILFGFSLLYGLSGGYTNLIDLKLALAANVSSHHELALLVPVMAVLILGGFAFKLSAAPFHMWTPDVYEGAPTPVAAFLNVVSKTAALAIAIRFIYLVLLPVMDWSGVMAILAVLSMVIGNTVAITQRNIKRLLAYSTIAHIGYVLLGFVVMKHGDMLATPDALGSMLFYLWTYLFMNLGAFAAVIYFAQLTGGREDIAAYAGLVQKRPALALVFSLFLLSLAGIPITAGFFAKLFLFQAVIAAGPQYLWLVVVALLASTVSLYYYLNVIRLMVVAEPSDAVERIQPEAKSLSGNYSWVGVALTFCLLGTLVLGMLAEPFVVLTRQAVRQLTPADSPMAAMAVEEK